MMLLAGDLKKKMMDAVSGADSADKALSALGGAISSYILDNAEISYTWAGINPSGAVDPITVASGGFVSLVIDLTVVKAVGSAPAPAGINAMKQALIAGLTASTHNIVDTIPPPAGFSTVPGLMITSPSLALLDLSGIQGLDNRDSIFDVKANSIVNWVKLQVPLLSIGGTHGVFVGTPPATGGFVVSIT